LFTAGRRLFRYGGPLKGNPPQPGKPLEYGAPITGGLHRIDEILVGARPGRAIATAGPVFSIGHLACDFTFEGDTTLAPRHCELLISPAGVVLKDRSLGLGTFVRIAGERAVAPKSMIRAGDVVFQVDAVA
jgi:hypothetical protein